MVEENAMVIFVMMEKEVEIGDGGLLGKEQREIERRFQGRSEKLFIISIKV